MKAIIIESAEELNKFLKNTKEKVHDIKYHPLLLRVITENYSSQLKFDINDRFLVLIEEK